MKNKTPKQNKQKEQMVKTTMSLPERLWKATKIRAIETGVDAQDIVAEALREHLTKGRKS